MLFRSTGEPVVFPLHPRTKQAIADGRLVLGGSIQAIDPVGYPDMVTLARHARLILTDSGGLQKEAYWLGVPCVTLREETEWTETVDAGWNVVAGVNAERIVDCILSFSPPAARPRLYGDGHASDRIVALLEENR